MSMLVIHSGVFSNEIYNIMSQYYGNTSQNRPYLQTLIH
jgi:hypothetical protein